VVNHGFRLDGRAPDGMPLSPNRCRSVSGARVKAGIINFGNATVMTAPFLCASIECGAEMGPKAIKNAILNRSNTSSGGMSVGRPRTSEAGVDPKTHQDIETD
jgi:hypothetical protein